MTQVCIPSIHKATSPARAVRKHSKPKKMVIPADEFKSRRTVDKLHTIGVIKGSPIPIPALKQMIVDYYNCYGVLPTRYHTSQGYYGNRTTVVFLPNFGSVTINYVESTNKEGLE